MCTERSHILKQTCTWKLQFCLRICDLLVASVKGLRKSFSVDFFCQNTEIVLLLCSYFSKPFFTSRLHFESQSYNFQGFFLNIVFIHLVAILLKILWLGGQKCNRFHCLVMKILHKMMFMHFTHFGIFDSIVILFNWRWWYAEETSKQRSTVIR